MGSTFLLDLIPNEATIFCLGFICGMIMALLVTWWSMPEYRKWQNQLGEKKDDQ